MYIGVCAVNFKAKRKLTFQDLRLKDENRELLYKGQLKRRGGAANENGDLQVFLFDHALLMVKAKTKHEQFRVFKRVSQDWSVVTYAVANFRRQPIPLELLVVTTQEEGSSARPATSKPRQTIMKRNSFSRDTLGSGAPSSLTPVSSTRGSAATILPIPLRDRETGNHKNGYPITFIHLGRKGYQMTLWASTSIGRKNWLEAIAKQQEVLRARSMTFETLALSENFFIGPNKVNCAVPFSE